MTHVDEFIERWIRYPEEIKRIRRMVKEKLVKFDGTPLFPERRAYTLNYDLNLAR
jgi:hypothetical protein